MENIVEICKEFGLTVGDDKKDDFLKKVSENYLTKAEHEKKIGKLEVERDTWKEKANTAETTLKGFDGVDLDTMKKELDDWKTKAANAEKSAQAQIYERDFSDALKTELESVKFSSEAAKRDVMAQIKAAELKLKDGKILGLSDLLEQIKKNDSSAFVDQKQEALEQSKARFTQPATTGSNGKVRMTKEQIMAIKDRSERRAAIAQHMELFEQ